MLQNIKYFGTIFGNIDWRVFLLCAVIRNARDCVHKLDAVSFVLRDSNRQEVEKVPHHVPSRYFSKRAIKTRSSVTINDLTIYSECFARFVIHFT